MDKIIRRQNAGGGGGGRICYLEIACACHALLFHNDINLPQASMFRLFVIAVNS